MSHWARALHRVIRDEEDEEEVEVVNNDDVDMVARLMQDVAQLQQELGQVRGLVVAKQGKQRKAAKGDRRKDKHERKKARGAGGGGAGGGGGRGKPGRTKASQRKDRLADPQMEWICRAVTEEALHQRAALGKLMRKEFGEEVKLRFESTPAQLMAALPAEARKALDAALGAVVERCLLEAHLCSVEEGKAKAETPEAAEEDAGSFAWDEYCMFAPSPAGAVAPVANSATESASETDSGVEQ